MGESIRLHLYFFFFFSRETQSRFIGELCGIDCLFPPPLYFPSFFLLPRRRRRWMSFSLLCILDITSFSLSLCVVCRVVARVCSCSPLFIFSLSLSPLAQRSHLPSSPIDDFPFCFLFGLFFFLLLAHTNRAECEEREREGER